MRIGPGGTECRHVTEEAPVLRAWSLLTFRVGSKHVRRGGADLAVTGAWHYDLPEPLEEVVPTLTH